MDGLEQLLRVNKYYEDKKKLYESVESDIRNKHKSAEAMRNGDIDSARQATNNIKDKAKKEYAKKQLNRKAEMQKQKEKQNKNNDSKM